MARIFISYKRVDKDNVFPIVEEIKQKTGVDCWIDLEGIAYGTQFASKICKAIDESDIVLFMYSKSHQNIDFEEDWTIKELNYATQTKKKVVLVKIDNTPLYNIFLLNYGSKNNCDATDEVQFHKLLRYLKRVNHSQTTLNDNINTKKILSEDNFAIIGIGSSSRHIINTIYQNHGLDCLYIDTDAYCYEEVMVPNKLLIGDGIGCSNRVERGYKYAHDSMDIIKKKINPDGKVLIFSSAFGGGTGGGVLKAISELNKFGEIRIGIFTLPFKFEGTKRRKQAEESLMNTLNSFDFVISVDNEKTREVAPNQTVQSCFENIDNIIINLIASITDYLKNATAYDEIKETFIDTLDTIIGKRQYSSFISIVQK